MDDFQWIYEAYYDSVYRYCLSLCRSTAVAEDLVQETFLKALKAIDKFKGDCKLQVWLCQIAKNTYFSQHKKTSRETPCEDEAVAADSVESLLVDKESAFEVLKVLHGLEEPYKEVFSLRVFGELPFAQIAVLFGRTESWSRVTFHRAKQKIKEGLK